MSPLRRALLWLLALQLIRPLVTALLRLAGLSLWLELMLQELLLWALPVLFLKRWQRPALRQKALLLAAIPAGGALQCLLAALISLWESLVPMGSAALPLPQSAGEWSLAILALGLVPAIAEESFFRGVLQPAARERMGSRPALALSTALFAAMHGSLSGLPAHLCVGFLCALCMERTGSLALCVVLHASYNLTALALTALELSASWGLLVLCGIIQAAFLLLLPRPQPLRGEGDRISLLLALLCLALAALTYLPA